MKDLFPYYKTWVHSVGMVGVFLWIHVASFGQVEISGVINHNTSVLSVSQPDCSDCDPNCKDTIAVQDASYFQVGDRALIIQMKGAQIDVSNTSTGGQISDIANAGNYEFFIVDSIGASGNLIFPEYGLIKHYDASGKVQVIRIPNFGRHAVTVSSALTAPTWNEATGVGGVMALVAKKLILNADINVVGSGFQGTQMLINGSPDNCTVSPATAFTLSSSATQSYTKGEGIVSNNNTYNRGRAPRANGGGSGISGDSGGGGGSSYGAGGIGGKRWCDVSGAVAGGLGGVSLEPYFTQDKLFLGGAGGAGFVTTNNPSTSTDGGGIIILFVDTLVGNGYSILANGTSPTAVNPVGAPDGGGGGGGGGSILLNVKSIEGSLTVTANGGDGQDLNTTNYHGPGGGGGGGVLLYSLPSLPSSVSFGATGGVGGEHSDGFRNASGNGTDGGTFGLYVPIENVNYRANVDGDDVAGVCDIDDDNDGIPDIQEIYVGDHDLDGILDFEDPEFCYDVFDGISGWSCALNGLPNPTADLDEDGYPNFFDADFPYCGSFVLGIDQICSNFDPDGDGNPSHLDLDSDNDGISDIIEGGGTDIDGDGQADSMVDSDADGLVDLYDMDDTDGPYGSDPCSIQPGCLEVTSLCTMPVSDSDNDGIPDFLDLDSDNDGISDLAEIGGVDVNGDGRIDHYGDSDGDGFCDLVDNEVCSINPEFGFYQSGSSVDIVDGNLASGPSDYKFAQVYETADRLVLDLGMELPVGKYYTLRWRRKTTYLAGPSADIVVEESSDNLNYFQNSVGPSDATQIFTSTLMRTEVPTRYIRLKMVGNTDDDFDFDAVGYTDTACVSGIPLILTGSDANGDGSPDSYLNGDIDSDGLINSIDLDSDNDGITDVVESGGTDNDGDGYADNYSDSDGDGFGDVIDGDPTNSLVLADDSDGSNSSQVQYRTSADNDNDAKPDSIIEDDFDLDGIPNFQDHDSDNDGISDLIEANGVDLVHDGTISGNDTDADGLMDSVDGDVGNDGIAENTLGALIITQLDDDLNGIPDGYLRGDADHDQKLNFIDIDSDNDGISDNTEAQLTSNYIAPLNQDLDQDGLDDAYDSDQGGVFQTPINTDSDSLADYLDRDSDNDSYPDIIEGHDSDGNGIPDGGSPANLGMLLDSADTDADGLLDGYDNNIASPDPTNGLLSPNSHPNVHNPAGDRDWRDNKDSDKDGIADFLDVDDDNDGIPDVDEDRGNDPDGNEDGDEYPNWLDVVDDGNDGDGSATNYTDLNSNGVPDIYDFDNDGVPNHLDKDADNDGIVDILEAGGVDANQDGEVDYPTSGVSSSMIDTDNDGLADLLDDVDNGAGVTEVIDGTPWPESNTDTLGFEDYLDIDADGDGIIDLIESQMTSASPIIPNNSDGDLDGISDSFDPDQGGVYIIPENTDGADAPDYIDFDSDNDGEIDQVEAWDFNGDGVVETMPIGSDADNDGLDDAFDLSAAGDNLINPTNNFQSAFDFPDADAGSDERDWRETPCDGNDVELASNGLTSTASSICRSDGWTYYYDPLDATKLLFAIEQKPSESGANSNDFSISVDLTVSDDPASENGVYSAKDVVTKQASFVLGRYWNVTLVSGGLNGFVNVRFFYCPNELDTLTAVAERWNQLYANGTSFVSGLRWFAMNSGTFDTSLITSTGITSAYELNGASSALRAGIDYVEFSTSSLTGGSVAYSIGINSVILPVEIIYFDAGVVDERNVLVIWQTSSEANSDRFFIEKSTNGNNWIFVGEVEAAGNSNSQQFYELLDPNPFYGTSYYRMHQVDFDGTVITTPSKEVNLRANSGEPALLVYPNPNSGTFQISIFSDLGVSGEIEVCTMTGTSVGRWTLGTTSVDKHSFEIQNLSAGHYLVIWRNGQTIMTTKVIVN